ncbi:glutathione S-transferase family protein [Lichenicoccus sp.]|uniref:glutathione S-transferase family protein n=1 Tax=Lichenicoccus sp. TaxID=2781899 RepID=UPI003D101957
METAPARCACAGCWVLEELQRPYRVQLVLFPPRVRQPAFLEENPLGSLPLFVDGAMRLTESMAICDYLVARHAPTPLAVGPDEPGFAAWRQFCWYGEANLMPPIGTLVGTMLLTPPEQRPAKPVDDARALLARRLRPVGEALAGAEYLAAGRFTLADVSVGYSLGLAAQLGVGDLFTEAMAFLERLHARPAYQRVAVPVNTP